MLPIICSLDCHRRRWRDPRVSRNETYCLPGSFWFCFIVLDTSFSLFFFRCPVWFIIDQSISFIKTIPKTLLISLHVFYVYLNLDFKTCWYHGLLISIFHFCGNDLPMLNVCLLIVYLCTFWLGLFHTTALSWSVWKTFLCWFWKVID